MDVSSKKQIVIENNDEIDDFLSELRSFCRQIRHKFDERDDVYKLMKDMEDFIVNIRLGEPFETRK